MFTPMDPLFVIFDALWSQQSERFNSVYDVLSSTQNLWWVRIGNCGQKQVEAMCDVHSTDDDDLNVENLYVKCNQAKMTQWLRAKVVRLDVYVFFVVMTFFH